MACKKWYMGTNTKMYKTIEDTKAFVGALCEKTADINRECFELFVIPSYTALDQANKTRDSSILKLGAQNMCWEDCGEFTGEISPIMLREVGCDLVMIGHSERRHFFGETDLEARKKVACAHRYGFTVLLCIGETDEEKQNGLSETVLSTQLREGLADVKSENLQKVWIAYEPVWAIGVSGKPIAIDYAEEMLTFIRGELVKLFGNMGNEIPVLYGGSVNPDNAAALSKCNNINGLFIGRSAWDADRFNALIRMVLREKEAK